MRERCLHSAEGASAACTWPRSCRPLAGSKVALGTTNACGTRWYDRACHRLPQTQETEVNGAPGCGPERSRSDQNHWEGRALSAFTTRASGQPRGHRTRSGFTAIRSTLLSSSRAEPRGCSTEGPCHSLALWPFSLGPQATTPLLPQGGGCDSITASKGQACPCPALLRPRRSQEPSLGPSVGSTHLVARTTLFFGRPFHCRPCVQPKNVPGKTCIALFYLILSHPFGKRHGYFSIAR